MLSPPRRMWSPTATRSSDSCPPSSFAAMTEKRQLTPRGRERRHQLMEYAAARFAEGGFHPTSVAEIVSGLGVGKGVFYWYFDSKEELLAEILKDAQLDLRRRQQQVIADEPDPLRRIELGIRATMEWIDEHRHLSTLFQFAATEERFARSLLEEMDAEPDPERKRLLEAALFYGLDALKLGDVAPRYETAPLEPGLDSRASVWKRSEVRHESAARHSADPGPSRCRPCAAGAEAHRPPRSSGSASAARRTAARTGRSRSG